MQRLLKNTSIKLQILIPTLLTTLIIIIGLTFSSLTLQTSLEHNTQSTENLIVYKEKLTRIIDNTYGMRISAIYSLFKPSEVAVLPDKLTQLSTNSKKLLNDLSHINGLNAETDEMQSAIQSYVNFSIQTMIPLLKKKQGAAALPPGFDQRYANASNKYRDAGRRMVAGINALSAKLNTVTRIDIKKNKNNHNHVLTISMVGLLFMLVLAIVCTNVLARMIVKPIHQIEEVMLQVAQGNLKVQADEMGNNEVSILGRNVNQTISQLRTMLDSLVTGSQHVRTASTQLAQLMDQTSTNAGQEQQQIDQVNLAISQLNLSSEQMNTNASDAEQSAHYATELAQKSFTMFEQTNNANHQMSDQLEKAAKMLQLLKNQSNHIGTIVSVIEDISEQTNLLALNAAIEAARAGENGRGFSVVAGEVRVLASRTRESTQQIKETISGLQYQSEQANDGMQVTLDMLKTNYKLQDQLNNSIKEIISSIDQLNNINTIVASSSKEQRQIASNTDSNLSTLLALVQQNLTGINKSTTVSEQLLSLSEQQNLQLSHFKL